MIDRPELSKKARDLFGDKISSVWNYKNKVKSNLKRYDIFNVNHKVDMYRERIPEEGKRGYDRTHDTFSQFNPDLCEAVYRIWAKKGDVVVDPFMGWGMRGVVAHLNGLNYIGYEISPTTIKEVKHTLNKVLETHFFSENTLTLNSILGDGTVLKESEDASSDIIFTCPPYWKLEKYESISNQLSDCPTYDNFMEFIDRCLFNCYRVLRNDRYMVWVIGDFRIDGIYYPFHGDFISLALKQKFILHDIIIRHYNNPFTNIDPSQAYTKRRTSKEHEYIIVMRIGVDGGFLEKVDETA